jgi:DNA-binding MarR family transcriptional regulator
MAVIKARNYFAAIPGRAIEDQNLSSLDLRVMAAVAAHDRMGRNGQPCRASLKTLAGKVGARDTSVSIALNRLSVRGYLEPLPVASDARRKAWRVIYDESADAAAMGVLLPKNGSLDGKPSPGIGLAGRKASAAANCQIDQSEHSFINGAANRIYSLESENISRSEAMRSEIPMGHVLPALKAAARQAGPEPTIDDLICAEMGPKGWMIWMEMTDEARQEVRNVFELGDGRLISETLRNVQGTASQSHRRTK